ncbi:von Willebrand factor D and EGF domain-containing protein-like [Saccostrea cucullata]|uniref:von Willebrand factor D and EGF domain-containing protein-like n=1 Tax=Saccostrea cuccullata TaxID=36930 RepID=UPI002ECFF686
MEWSGHYNIDLEILPSAMDIGNADGLCGYFDGDRENDFRRRNSTITDDISQSYPNDFSRSWMIPDNENLFSGSSLVYSGLQSVSSILVPHCACTEDGKTQCSYNTFTPCNSNRGKQYECNVDLVQNRRRKRDVSDMSMERDPLLRMKRTISYVQTTEYSERVCLQAFENSPEYNTCQQHVNDLSNVTLSNCIEDIRMTGDDNLTQIHVEAALQQCSTFVLLNATLQEAEPEVTYTIQNLCPSNCTGHGTCDGGNCTCDTGFGGSDCSFDLLAPPTITSVPGAGLCDRSTKTCKEATIMGKYFFENMNSICYLTVKQTKINQTEESEERQMNLQERTLFEGFCPLPYDTTDIWTTEVKFNISNDGVRYTDTYNVIIYQSHCQEYHNESGNVYFTLKDDFCYIDSTCISPMQNSSTNECLYCNATNDKFNWTENECKCQSFIMKRYSSYFPLHCIILNAI